MEITQSCSDGARQDDGEKTVAGLHFARHERHHLGRELCGFLGPAVGATAPRIEAEDHAVYAATYAFWLSRIFNPPADIARYAAVVLIVGGIVMALFARFALRHP